MLAHWTEIFKDGDVTWVGRSKVLAGTIATTSVASGPLVASKKVVGGTTVTTSSVTGALTRFKSLAGTITTTSNITTGTLKAIKKVLGTIDTQSGVTGSVAGIWLIAGTTIAGQSVVSGSLDASKKLTGTTITTQSVVDAALLKAIKEIAVDWDISGYSYLWAGWLKVKRELLGINVAARCITSGTLEVSTSFASTTVCTSSVTGTLVKTSLVSGVTIAGQSVVSGALDVEVVPVEMEGVVTTTSGVSGPLSVSKKLAGTIPTTDCVAHWKLNDKEATTVVLDAIGNNTGTLLGGDNTEDKSVAGKVGDALDLNGIDDYVDCNSSFQPTFRGSFSMSFWAKPDDGRPATNERFFGAYDGDSYVNLFYAPTGLLYFYYMSEGNMGNHARTVNEVFPDGATEWTHIVVTADSTIGGIGGKKIYVNGVEAELHATYNGNTTGVDFSEFTSAQNLFLGALNADGSDTYYYAGAIDNVQLFDRALSLEDITTLYNDGNGTEDKYRAQSVVSGTLITIGMLDGTIATTSVVSGTLAVTKELAGTVATQSTITGSLKVVRELTGIYVYTWGGAAGTLEVTLEVAGVVTTQSSVTGTVSRVRGVSRTTIFQSGITGTLGVTKELTVITIGSESTVLGSIEVTRKLSGTITTQAVVTGDLIEFNYVTGIITTQSVVSGSLAVSKKLYAITICRSSLTGSILSVKVLAGLIVTQSSISGTLEPVPTPYFNLISAVGIVPIFTQDLRVNERLKRVSVIHGFD